MLLRKTSEQVFHVMNISCIKVLTIIGNMKPEHISKCFFGKMTEHGHVVAGKHKQ